MNEAPGYTEDPERRGGDHAARARISASSWSRSRVPRPRRSTQASRSRSSTAPDRRRRASTTYAESEARDSGSRSTATATACASFVPRLAGGRRDRPAPARLVVLGPCDRALPERRSAILFHCLMQPGTPACRSTAPSHSPRRPSSRSRPRRVPSGASRQRRSWSAAPRARRACTASAPRRTAVSRPSRIRCSSASGARASSGPICTATPTSPDGTGTPEDYLAYARDVARARRGRAHRPRPLGRALSSTENPELWKRIRTGDPGLRRSPGASSRCSATNGRGWLQGHRHVLYFSDGGEVLSSMDDRYQTPDQLWKGLAGSAGPDVRASLRRGTDRDELETSRPIRSSSR